VEPSVGESSFGLFGFSISNNYIWDGKKNSKTKVKKSVFVYFNVFNEMSVLGTKSESHSGTASVGSDSGGSEAGWLQLGICSRRFSTLKVLSPTAPTTKAPETLILIRLKV
jgi:hypothetical protein